MLGHDDDNVREWDRRYTDIDGAAMWSGRPNGALVDEVTGLTPGSALDVGCGEGADAIWLARQGWRVTALDPSGVAILRARDAARSAGVELRWLQVGLLEVAPYAERYDLVSAHYPVLRHTEDGAAVAGLSSAVAPGGTLLVVHHELMSDHAAEHGFDPADHVMPADVAAQLDERWVIEVDGARPRRGPLSPDARHVRDLVLRARFAP